APFSIARIGSTSPALVAILVEPAASCWITAAFDCANMKSTFRPAAAKKPFWTPMWTGQAFAELEPTAPTITVSSARACGASVALASPHASTPTNDCHAALRINPSPASRQGGKDDRY